MARKSTSASAEEQFKQFLGRYSPEIVEQAEPVLAAMRKRLPGAVELVYDNYNALVVGFSPTGKPSDAVFSIAFFPRWISLFFLQVAHLTDPHQLLKGKGTVARHLVLEGAGTLENPAVRSLMEEAVRVAAVPYNPASERKLVIRSISAKQRPRLPGTGRK